MALLPQDQRDQKRFLGVVLAVAVLGLFVYYIYMPRSQELDEQEDRIAQLQQQNRQARAQIGNLDELRAELRRQEQLFAVLQDLVPPRGEIPAVYESIAEEVETLGLELNRVTPSNPQPVEGGYYQQQTWQMEVEGSYHTVGEFLTRVASHSRIIRPVVQEIRPASRTNTGELPVVAGFGLEMYVLPPDTASAGSGGSDASS
jgi:type IV pilus assembly protein PilO